MNKSHLQADAKASSNDVIQQEDIKVKRMQAYLNHFQRPPPNRLVTRKLESENTYDEGAWSDHHWEETMAKQVEITDSPNISNVFDDTFVKKTPTTTINSTLSASKLDLHNGLQAVNQCNIDDTMYYKDLNSTNENVQNKYDDQILKQTELN